MKTLRFLPVVYLIGIHGFLLFAPYVALLLTARYTLRRVRLHPVPVPAN